MLNIGSPGTEIKKTDLSKVKKLEEALAKIKSGEENYYVITKLSNIKVTVAMYRCEPVCGRMRSFRTT